MKPHMTITRTQRPLRAALLLLWLTTQIALAQNGPPPYPRVNLAKGYVADAPWPQRPPGVAWGQMPGVAVDRQDNVWIYTRTNPAIQVYAPDGHYLFGWPAGHSNSVAHYIRFDREGNIWTADVGRHIVTKRSPQGTRLLTLGTEDQPGEDGAHFKQPTDMVIAPNGDIFVTDGYGNSRVVHFDKRGRFLKAWGKLGTASGEFSIPHAIARDSKGRLYVADRNNVRVQIFNERGKLLDVWQNVLVPWDIWISPTDEIWICGSSPMLWGVDPKYPRAPLGCPPKDQLIARFDTVGRVRELWTFPKGQDDLERPGEVNWLHAMAFDSQGHLYLGDIIGRRVQKFNPSK